MSLMVICSLLRIINENFQLLGVTQDKCELSEFSRQDTFFSGIAIV